MKASRNMGIYNKCKAQGLHRCVRSTSSSLDVIESSTRNSSTSLQNGLGLNRVEQVPDAAKNELIIFSRDRGHVKRLLPGPWIYPAQSLLLQTDYNGTMTFMANDSDFNAPPRALQVGKNTKMKSRNRFV